MSESQPASYADLVQERDMLRSNLAQTSQMLSAAVQELVALRAELARVKKANRIVPRDPNASDTFRRPYR